MRTTKKIMVEKEETTYSCDIKGCNYSTTRNDGCCGVAPIMSCNLCGQDNCKDHREYFWECEWSDDRPTMHICSDCIQLGAGRAWEAALQTAGRYESLYELTKQIFNTWTDKDYEELFYE